MKICSLHLQPSVWNDFTANGKNYKFWGCPTYKETKCKAEQIDKGINGVFEPQVEMPKTTRETVKEEKVDWEAKDRQSLAQTAMKSASEIVSAMLTVNYFDSKDLSPREMVKEMANEFYKELKKMKSSE